LLLIACGTASTHAETIKIGISKLIGYPGVPIAVERGYFKEQGLEAQMIYFDSAQPIAIAVASGDVEFGVAGMSASFYTLAAQGQLRLIASSGGDAPGFYNLAFVASNKAYEGGLKAVKDMSGHSVAITQLGTSLHFAVGQAAEKYGIPMSAITVKPLQSNTNAIAALIGGTVDAAVLPGSPVLPALNRNEIKLLSWAADVAPNLTGSACFTATKIANDRGDMVKRFLTAYRKGMHDFHDAFVNKEGKRENGPTAPAILTLMSNFTGVPSEQIAQAIPYIDPDGRIDADSVARQVAWYRAQNLLKGEVDAKVLIDHRYALLKVANK
jgi:NitT/TauT family transport system substrate-binding protein